MPMGTKFVLTCRDVTEHATDYMENALPLRTRLAMRLHLFICRMCRTYMDQLRRTAALLRGHRLAAPPPEVEARIVAAGRLASRQHKENE